MPNEAIKLDQLNQMVTRAINDLKNNVEKADHPISKLATIARYEGYGIALRQLGADTKELGLLVETEAEKIEPSLRKFF